MNDRPTWKYDPEARAGYLKLRDEPWARTRRVNDVVLVELDVDDNIIGIEILDVDKDPGL